MIEYDDYMRVWTLSERSAREFFGAGDDAIVVVLKDGPETAQEKERYLPEAKLFGVRQRSLGPALKSV